MRRVFLAIISVAFLAFLTVGCSTTRLVDSDVTAFPKWNAAPPGPGTAYRFERLPSQQAVGAPQDRIEALARTALSRVGMELNPAVARYSVQVVLNTQVVDRGLYDGVGYDGFGFATPGVFVAGGNRGASVGLSFPMRFPEPPYFKRELVVLMRDLTTQQVVFETRALHDGVWSDSLSVLPAMLDAALRGFPEPAPGRRRINVEIPR
jgi:predicted small secreted protein